MHALRLVVRERGDAIAVDERQRFEPRHAAGEIAGDVLLVRVDQGRIDGGEDGVRVFFLMPRPPFGAMAERSVVSPKFCFPIPDEVDDATAAAVFNPGLSA